MSSQNYRNNLLHILFGIIRQYKLCFQKIQTSLQNVSFAFAAVLCRNFNIDSVTHNLLKTFPLNQPANALSLSCEELTTTFSPWVGCKYPVIAKTEEQTAQIEMKCKDKEGDQCCEIVSFFELAEIYVDGKFNGTKIAETFSYRWIKDIDTASKDSWQAVIENSVETCIKLSKSFESFLRFLFLVTQIFLHSPTDT